MSIFEETGGGLAAVGHDRSLELFCDRHEVIAHFVSLVNDDPPPRRVLYLHGLGGNGKSLLLRFLAARCCVRLPPGEWQRVRRLPEAELPAALSGIAKAVKVPVARIDFGARPVGELRPQECFSALFMLKQQLSGFRVATPRFDFAAVTYLHKLGFDLGRRLPELFPAVSWRRATLPACREVFGAGLPLAGGARLLGDPVAVLAGVYHWVWRGELAAAGLERAPLSMAGLPRAGSGEGPGGDEAHAAVVRVSRLPVLRVGDRVRSGGGEYQVAGLDGAVVRLVPGGGPGGPSVVLLTHLPGAADFAVLSAADDHGNRAGQSQFSWPPSEQEMINPRGRAFTRLPAAPQLDRRHILPWTRKTAVRASAR